MVSAMLSITGVQSSLPVEDSRLSMAPLMMSIPGERMHTGEHERGDDGGRNLLRVRKRVLGFKSGLICTYGTIH